MNRLKWVAGINAIKLDKPALVAMGNQNKIENRTSAFRTRIYGVEDWTGTEIRSLFKLEI